MKKLVSIVTVCRNAKSEILETLKSGFDQDLNDFEYIVIDGGSKDGTLEVIEPYLSKLAHFESGPDKGIYDAMNKAIEHCEGEYTLFMNAGDRFFSNDVLDSFKEYFAVNVADIIYGDTIVENSEFKLSLKISAKNVDELEYGMIACHQSIFFKTALLKEIKFDYSEKLVADYKFLIEALNQEATFKKVDKTVSVVSSGGVSDQNQAVVFRAWNRCGALLKNRSPVVPIILEYRAAKAQFFKKIKKMLPKTCLNLLFRIKNYRKSIEKKALR